jgi:hypothetical protein
MVQLKEYSLLYSEAFDWLTGVEQAVIMSWAGSR